MVSYYYYYYYSTANKVTSSRKTATRVKQKTHTQGRDNVIYNFNTRKL